MGKDPATYKSGQMTYDLRRLKLHGLIERIPHSHRYQVTDKGIKVSLFYTKVYGRVLQGGLSQLFDGFDCNIAMGIETSFRLSIMLNLNSAVEI